VTAPAFSFGGRNGWKNWKGIEPAVEWLRRQGHRLVFSPGTCWYDAAPGIFQAFPYHAVITPSEDELRHVFTKGRVYGLGMRFFFNVSLRYN
jgi:hypothetical protein